MRQSSIIEISFDPKSPNARRANRQPLTLFSQRVMAHDAERANASDDDDDDDSSESQGDDDDSGFDSATTGTKLRARGV